MIVSSCVRPIKGSGKETGIEFLGLAGFVYTFELIIGAESRRILVVGVLFVCGSLNGMDPISGVTLNTSCLGGDLLFTEIGLFSRFGPNLTWAEAGGIVPSVLNMEANDG